VAEKWLVEGRVPYAAGTLGIAQAALDMAVAWARQRETFGSRLAAVVGWCFYFAVPAGAPAAAMFGGAYVAAAFGGGLRTTLVTAAGLMAVVTLVLEALMFAVGLRGRDWEARH